MSMDVSNSTGQSTGYRVVGAGGATVTLGGEDSEREACLKAGATEACQFPLPECSFLVKFLIDGREVASATFYKDPGEVNLYEDEWGVHVRSCASSNGSNGDIPR
jgi:hypothetical protein